MGSMSLDRLERTIRPGERVLVDTTTLIAYLNREELATLGALHMLNEMIQSGRTLGIVSMVTVMEILVRPLRVGAPEPYQHVMEFITQFPNLSAVPIDLVVAQEAASVRAMFRLSPPDALIVASGLVRQVHHLVTNDGAWVRKLQPIAARIRVCQLDRYT